MTLNRAQNRVIRVTECHTDPLSTTKQVPRGIPFNRIVEIQPAGPDVTAWNGAQAVIICEQRTYHVAESFDDVIARCNVVPL